MQASLNRKQCPHIELLHNIEFTPIKPSILSNGLELYSIDKCDKEVTRLDFMFQSGKWDQTAPLSAIFSNTLLKEGTQSYTSAEIAEKLDYYGAWIQPSVTQHNSYLTVYTLNKHFNQVIPIIEEMIKSPTFPEKEFGIHCNRQREQYMVEMNKVQVLALHASMEQLYGLDHPYGAHATLETFNHIKLDNIKDFYNRAYKSSNCTILITGKITSDILKEVENRFGAEAWGNNDLSFTAKNTLAHPAADHYTFVEKEDTQQCALRIAMPSINREHPDYNGFRVLNTIYGGYFGSRLMENIREEKGYTYGIGSSTSANKYGAHMVISTQTANIYRDAVIDEIFKEMDRLKIELVGQEELLTVKSYLMGEMARMFDGPFAQADAQISLTANNLEDDYYQKQIQIIKNISAEEIRDLAIKYFVKENFYTTIAGSR